jgi:hypothetical protein
MLPTDRAFLRGVYLSHIHALVEKEDLEIIEQEVVRIGIRDIDSEVIYELILLLKPFLPTALTYAVEDALADFVRKGGELHLPFLATAPEALESVTRKNSHGQKPPFQKS